MKIKPLKDQVAEFERKAIARAAKLETNKTRLAAMLGVSTETVRRKLAGK